MGNQILFKVIIKICSTINNWKFILFKIIERIFLDLNHLQSQGSIEAYNKKIQYFLISVKRFNKRWVWFWRVNEFLAFYNDMNNNWINMDYLSNGKLIHLRINWLGDAWPLRRSCFAQTALPLTPKPQLLSKPLPLNHLLIFHKSNQRNQGSRSIKHYNLYHSIML